jgi:carbon-monoxide dehydrogenase large subunit
VVEVEIEPETGKVAIVRYVAVDDVGTVINPLLMEGQLHGGIVQGVGQIVMENVVWDRESGQLVAGSFMDYTMPRADDLPSFEMEINEVPTPTNPMGIKGAGEAGCVGAMPAVMNAIVDALGSVGVRTFDMPATPERVWRAIQDAPSRLAAE